MTEDALKEIEARANLATPNLTANVRSDGIFLRGSDRLEHVALFSGTNLVNDSNFYQHARTDIPALIAHIRSQDAEMKLQDAELRLRNFFCDTAIARLETELHAVREEITSMQTKAEKQFALYEARIGQLIAQNNDARSALSKCAEVLDSVICEVDAEGMPCQHLLLAESCRQAHAVVRKALGEE